MANFQKYEPGKNIKICSFTGIVPAAARFIQSKTPRLMKGENIGAFLRWKKIMKHKYLKTSNWTGAGVRCLVCKINFRSCVRKCLLT